MQYTKSLKFEQTPNYSKHRKIFKRLFREKLFNKIVIFDWILASANHTKHSKEKNKDKNIEGFEEEKLLRTIEGEQTVRLMNPVYCERKASWYADTAEIPLERISEVDSQNIPSGEDFIIHSKRKLSFTGSNFMHITTALVKLEKIKSGP